MFGKDSSHVQRTADFNLPVRCGRDGRPKIMSGEHLFACMTSDFFLDLADEWRPEAWEMIRMRQDVRFTIITKRVLRIAQCLPQDWASGYENVEICATIENQRRAEERMEAFLALPIRRKSLICEPLLENVDLSPWLHRGIESVTLGGESGDDARPLHYDWVLNVRDQCQDAGVRFHFKQTGARFVKDGKLYNIERKLQHVQAKRAGINLY